MGIIDMNLLSIRTQYGLSQIEASIILNIPVRTYIRYEKDDNYGSGMKREMMIRTLIEKCEITEEKGLLTIEQIKTVLTQLFESEYKGQIDFCYLFGSYAKGYAKDNSDVDLCIATELKGLKFAGLSESIRRVLHKRVDLVRFSNLKDNLELINEIMKGGVKIYG